VTISFILCPADDSIQSIVPLPWYDIQPFPTSRYLLTWCQVTTVMWVDKERDHSWTHQFSTYEGVSKSFRTESI